jgi:hypothetical protein
MPTGGDAKVTKNKRRLGLAIPVTLYEKLVHNASYQGKTLNSLCLDIFWAWANQQEKAG